jgi:hypothetical protein
MKSKPQITMRISLFVVVFIGLTLFFNPIASFSQCTPTNLLTENFNGYAGAANDATAINTYLTGNGESGGGNTGSTWISDDAKSVVGMCCGWKGNAASCTQDPAGGGDEGCTSCADPNTRKTGASGAVGDRALIIDPDFASAAPNKMGTVWCYTASGSYSAGTIFMIQADYTSPWCITHSGVVGHDPTIWWTVGGTTVAGTTATVTQWSGASMAYVTQTCYYTVPSGGLTNPPICINMCLKISTIDAGCNGGNAGNDVMIDNIQISTISGGGCTSSGCTVTPTTTTPITLLDFKVAKNGFGIDIKWQTASQINNDYFIVQKSINGIDFIDNERIEGAGNSNSILNYQTTDHSPYNGISYYRLKQVDYNGSFSYSKIESVIFNDNKISIYPNPGTGIFNILGLNGETIISVQNLLGQVLMIQEATLNSSVIDLSSQPDGVYFIQVNNGDISANTKIILHR